MTDNTVHSFGEIKSIVPSKGDGFSKLPRMKKISVEEMDSKTYYKGEEFREEVRSKTEALIKNDVLDTLMDYDGGTMIGGDDDDEMESSVGLAPFKLVNMDLGPFIVVSNPFCKMPCKVSIGESTIHYGNKTLRRGGEWDSEVIRDLVKDVDNNEVRKIKVIPNCASTLPESKPAHAVKESRPRKGNAKSHRVVINTTGKVTVVVPEGTEVSVEYA